MRRARFPLLLPLVLLAGLTACGDGTVPDRIDAYDAPRTLWDLSGAEPPPTGTVTVGQTAAEGGTDAGRGAELYGILCTPCHGARGAGDGPVVGRYVPAPPPLDLPRLRAADDAALLAVIAHGHGRMYGFADRADAAARQAILAHLRMLQSGGMPEGDTP